GQLVDLAQFENTCALVGPALLDFAANGRTASPFGNRSQERPAAPHGVYPCRGNDRWCAITVFDDAQWQALVAVLGHPSWTADVRFASRESRCRHSEPLDASLSQWTRTRDAHEVMEMLQNAGVPAGIVADAIDLCDRNPQLASRG